jgi:hypothetical protein
MGGMGAGVRAGGSVGGSSGVNGDFGGRSNADISAQGRANTNGPNAADRDYGADRAQDRSVRPATASATARVQAASELGKLNAAHASATAEDHAASGSTVGHIATYETQMKAALAISDPAKRTAAITAARQELAASDNKQLTPSAVARVDGRLGIKGAPPELGAAR